MNQKIIISTLHLLLSCSFSVSNAAGCIKGIIEKPAHYSGVFECVVRYGGDQDRLNSDGFYTIPLHEPVQVGKKLLTVAPAPIQTPSLLICSNQKEIFDKKNTLATVKHNHKELYRYFEQDDSGEWKEKNLPAHTIPTNCVHIIMNPRLVAHVQMWDLQLPESIIKMPKVIIDPKASAQELQTSSGKSTSAGIDLERFHKPIPSLKTESKTPGKTSIELKYASA